VITVTSEIKDRFFDRARVVAYMGREDARRLGKMGAFIQRRAKTKILRRAPRGRRGSRGQRPSARPGQPPLVHSTNERVSLRRILFGLTADWNGVAIGPVAIADQRLRGSSAQTVPQLLTKGGRGRVDVYSNDGGRTWEAGHAPQADEHRSVAANYREHPFMGPALNEEIAAGTVDRVWSSS
jgi:hypothetical protein